MLYRLIAYVLQKYSGLTRRCNKTDCFLVRINKVPCRNLSKGRLVLFEASTPCTKHFCDYRQVTDKDNIFGFGGRKKAYDIPINADTIIHFNGDVEGLSDDKCRFFCARGRGGPDLFSILIFRVQFASQTLGFFGALRGN